jgi:hypothetical protein
MDTLQRFLAYAGDFEKTYVDDDWSRLYQYFNDDALYDVQSKAFGCKLEGPRAIFAGIKKSLDGFDRKFTTRKIDVVGAPEIDGDELRMKWTVTYQKDGVDDFVLRGQSVVRYRDGKIAYLSDRYDPSIEKEFGDWQRKNRLQLDVSYT